MPQALPSSGKLYYPLGQASTTQPHSLSLSPSLSMS